MNVQSVIAQREFLTDSQCSTTRTDEGFLRGEVIGTRCGVFDYPDPEGGNRLVPVARLPADVFDAESIASASMAPVTLEHPERKFLGDGRPDPTANGLVNVDNAHRLSVGSLGNTHRIDGEALIFPYTVTNGDAIAAVDAGKRGLSMGYKLRLVKQDGEYNGVKYMYVQKDIRYNHMAIVNAGRVGPTARINLDSLAWELDSTKGTERMKTTIALDIAGTGTPINYEMDQEAAAHITALTTKLTTLQTALDTAKSDLQKETAAKDLIKTDLDKANQEIKDLPGKLKTALDARAALEKKAANWMKPEDITAAAALDDAAFVKTAVAAHEKGKTLTLDGQTDVYIRAAFDMLPEKGGEGEETENVEGDELSRQREIVHGGGSAPRVETDSAPKLTGREKMLARNKNLSKGEDKKS